LRSYVKDYPHRLVPAIVPQMSNVKCYLCEEVAELPTHSLDVYPSVYYWFYKYMYLKF
jgi:hypothetical protein